MWSQPQQLPSRVSSGQPSNTPFTSHQEDSGLCRGRTRTSQRPGPTLLPPHVAASSTLTAAPKLSPSPHPMFSISNAPSCLFPFQPPLSTAAGVVPASLTPSSSPTPQDALPTCPCPVSTRTPQTPPLPPAAGSHRLPSHTVNVTVSCYSHSSNQR